MGSVLRGHGLVERSNSIPFERQEAEESGVMIDSPQQMSANLVAQTLNVTITAL